MHKKRQRKLTLHRETLHVLPEHGLKPALGGESGGGCTVETQPGLFRGGTRIDDSGC